MSRANPLQALIVCGRGWVFPAPACSLLAVFGQNITKGSAEHVSSGGWELCCSSANGASSRHTRSAYISRLDVLICGKRSSSFWYVFSLGGC